MKSHACQAALSGFTAGDLNIYRSAAAAPRAGWARKAGPQGFPWAEAVGKDHWQAGSQLTSEACGDTADVSSAWFFPASYSLT